MTIGVLALQGDFALHRQALEHHGRAGLEVDRIGQPAHVHGRHHAQVAVAAGRVGGVGRAVALTPDTGYFWFFSSNNVELVIKVVDGRAFNGFFWVFYGALSDVEYTITVTDTDTGAVKTYTNPQGRLASVADVAAFPS